MTKATIKAAAGKWRARVRELEVELDRRTVTWMAVLAGSLGLAVGALGTCGGEAVADQRVPADAPVVITSPESVIELRFTEHEQLSGRGLDAQVKGRVAVLTGTVKTEADRELAARLALVSGVDRVDNQLALEPPPPAPSRQARVNPPLTREQRERRKRSAAAEPVAVTGVGEAAAPVAPVARPAVEAPAAAPVAQPAAVRPAPSPSLTPAVTGAVAVPPGPATGLSASAPSAAVVAPAPSPAQILKEGGSPASTAATVSPPLAADRPQ